GKLHPYFSFCCSQVGNPVRRTKKRSLSGGINGDIRICLQHQQIVAFQHALRGIIDENGLCYTDCRKLHEQKNNANGPPHRQSYFRAVTTTRLIEQMKQPLLSACCSSLRNVRCASGLI